MSNPKIEKWKKWLNIIFSEILTLNKSCYMYCEIREIVMKNSQINRGNHFYEWITRNYVTGLLMGIRRQLDNSQNTCSLMNLLQDFKKNHALLSRSQHLSNYQEGWEQKSNQNFDNLVGKNIEMFFVEEIEKDIQELEDIKTKYSKYIDNRIAHHDKRRNIQVLGTFKDLEDAVSVFDRILNRYSSLIFARALETRPSLPSEWKDIFLQPWIINEDDRL